MLKTAKPKLQQDIESILKDSLYKAFMTTMEQDANPDPVIKKKLDADLKKAAENFSETASKEAGGKLADAIFNFVLEIGIIAQPKMLTSPIGPVAGTIIEKEFTIL